MRTLTLGVLAHVDAGKTTLTERLLVEAGVLAEPGSVDAGSTHTDTMALERRRGITIRAAVVSFEVDGTTVNLVDSPATRTSSPRSSAPWASWTAPCWSSRRSRACRRRRWC